jgi:hypothetical protein
VRSPSGAPLRLSSRLTLGSFPAWPTQQARMRAKELKRAIDLGSDPVGDGEALRAEPTLAQVIERDIARERFARQFAADLASLCADTAFPPIVEKRLQSRHFSGPGKIKSAWTFSLSWASTRSAASARTMSPSCTRGICERGSPVAANRTGKVEGRRLISARLRASRPAVLRPRREVLSLPS